MDFLYVKFTYFSCYYNFLILKTFFKEGFLILNCCSINQIQGKTHGAALEELLFFDERNMAQSYERKWQISKPNCSKWQKSISPMVSSGNLPRLWRQELRTIGQIGQISQFRILHDMWQMVFYFYWSMKIQQMF